MTSMLRLAAAALFTGKQGEKSYRSDQEEQGPLFQFNGEDVWDSSGAPAIGPTPELLPG